MYIRKEKIKNVWALLSNDKPDGDDIRKFESLGTRSMASEMAIGAAVDYHLLIGSQRKEERLRYLKNYWCNKVANLPNVKLNTSLKNAYSCAIANFSINGLTPAEIDTQLWDKYKIHAVAIVWHNISGVRITPHVYTTPRDLDKLATAITNIAEQAGKKG
jgi:selenocysteine lyase/cysteine desulfurase